MQLNEIHNEHEHATTSLKAVLLVFAIVLVGALGYLVWAQNTEPDSTDYSATPTTTQNKEVVADDTVDCGDGAYAYSLTFGAKWTGYKVKEATPAEAIIYCYFNMPTVDPFWATASSTNIAGYVSLLAVGVYTPAQWTASQLEANKPAELGHNASYYWGWTPAQSYPDALKTVSDDIPTVVATFAINP